MWCFYESSKKLIFADRYDQLDSDDSDGEDDIERDDDSNNEDGEGEVDLKGRRDVPKNDSELHLVPAITLYRNASDLEMYYFN